MKAMQKELHLYQELHFYEEWYRDGGLADYEKVFRFNNEKDIQAEIGIKLLEPVLSTYKRDTLKVLDIGCGTGKFTILLLSKINSIRPEMIFDVDLIDSSTDALRQFQQRAKSQSAIRIGSKYEMTWRAFRQKALAKKAPPKYDFIDADHSLYAEPITRENFLPLLSFLEPGGMLLVALESKRSIVRKMRETLGIFINCSEYLINLLESEGVKYKRLSYESKLYYSDDDPVFIKWFFMIPKDEEESGDWRRYWDILNAYSTDNGTSFCGCSKYILNVGDMILITKEEGDG